MSEPRPKFIQITNSNALDGDGHEREQLYALDELGIVWWYDFVDNTWNLLPDNQLPIEAPEPAADGGSNA